METANGALRLNLDRKLESWYGGVLNFWTDRSGVGKKTAVLQCHEGEKTENSRPSTRYNIYVIAWNVDCGEGKQSQIFKWSEEGN